MTGLGPVIMELSMSIRSCHYIELLIIHACFFLKKLFMHVKDIYFFQLNNPLKGRSHFKVKDNQKQEEKQH